MDVRRSGMSAEIHEQVDGFLQKRWSIENTRALLASDTTADDLVAEAAGLGWTDLLVAEEDGGLGFGVEEAGGLFEAVGWHLAPGPWFDLVVTGAMCRSVPEVEPGWHVALAAPPIADDVAGWDRVEVTSGRLRGTHAGVHAARAADAHLVLAQEGGAPVLGLVEASGARHERLPTMDVTVRPYRVSYEDVELISPLAQGDDALRMFSVLRARAHALYAAELLGLVDRVLGLAVEYALDREQFGRPIGSFQAVQELLVRMAVLRDTTRNVTYASHALLDAEDPAGPRMASSAKAHASRAGREVMENALQVFGGIGYTAEHDLHLFFKRTLTRAGQWGDHDAHARRRSARDAA